MDNYSGHYFKKAVGGLYYDLNIFLPTLDICIAKTNKTKTAYPDQGISLN